MAVGAVVINHFNNVNDTVPQVAEGPQNEMDPYFQAVPYNIDEYLSDEGICNSWWSAYGDDF